MTILAIVLLAVAAGIAFLNMQAVVTLNLYFTSLTLPLWLVLLGALLTGMLAAWLLAGAAAAARRKSIRQKEEELQAELDRKEEELAAARREKEDIADRTRLETEKDYQMKQKDEEIANLNERLASMEAHLGNMENQNANRSASNPTSVHQTTVETRGTHPDETIVATPDSDRVVYKDMVHSDSTIVTSANEPASPEIAADPSQANVSASDKPGANPKRPR